MPSKLDPHLARIEVWLAAEPQLTALAIVHRLAEMDAVTFSDKQHSIVQRLLRSLRGKAARMVVAATTTQAMTYQDDQHGPGDGAAFNGHSGVAHRPFGRASLSAPPASALRCHPILLARVTFPSEAIRGVKIGCRLTHWALSFYTYNKNQDVDHSFRRPLNVYFLTAANAPSPDAKPQRVPWDVWGSLTRAISATMEAHRTAAAVMAPPIEVRDQASCRRTSPTRSQISLYLLPIISF